MLLTDGSDGVQSYVRRDNRATDAILVAKVKRHQFHVSFSTLVDLHSRVLDLSSSRTGTRSHTPRAAEDLAEAFDLVVSQELDLGKARDVLLIDNGLGTRNGKTNTGHGSAHRSVHHKSFGSSNRCVKNPKTKKMSGSGQV